MSPLYLTAFSVTLTRQKIQHIHVSVVNFSILRHKRVKLSLCFINYFAMATYGGVEV
jgi:hypothetical protein